MISLFPLSDLLTVTPIDTPFCLKIFVKKFMHLGWIELEKYSALYKVISVVQERSKNEYLLLSGTSDTVPDE